VEENGNELGFDAAIGGRTKTAPIFEMGGVIMSDGKKET
jgi:hypothetical protein